MLDGTFSDVLRHVARATTAPPLENGPPSPLPQAKKRCVDTPSAGPAKRGGKRSTAAEESWVVKVVRRAGELTDLKINGPETNANFRDDSAKKPSGADVGLSQSWSSDSGRCVDASPVLLVQDRTGQRSEGGKGTVFIGSHSHRFQALDLSSGSLLWERVLGDRIESSAAVSLCGSLVIVGQYQIYRDNFLNSLVCVFLAFRSHGLDFSRLL